MSSTVMDVKRSLSEADLVPAKALAVGTTVLIGDESLYGFAVTAVKPERDGTLRVDLDNDSRWFLDPDEDVLVDSAEGAPHDG